MWSKRGNETAVRAVKEIRLYEKGFQSGKGLKAFFIYAHAEHIISAILGCLEMYVNKKK